MLPSTTTATSTMKCTPVDLDAINCELIHIIQTLWQMSEQLQQLPSTVTTMTTPPPTPMPMQDPTTTNSNLPLPLAATTESTLDQLWMPMPMMMMTNTPNQPMLQDLLLTPSSSTLRKLPQPAPINLTSPTLQIQDMELKQLSPHALMLMTPPNDDTAYPTTEPSKHHLTTATPTPFLPTWTWMEWLLSNLHHRNIVLWMPDAIYWHLTQNQSNTQDPAPAHPIEHTTHIPYLFETILYHINNSLLANYAASPYNLAFDIHPKMPDHCQNAISTIHSLPTMPPAPTTWPWISIPH